MTELALLLLLGGGGLLAARATRSGGVVHAGPPAPAGGTSAGAASSDPDGLNRAELEAMARTIWGEARGQPYAGLLAVGHVILNRVKDGQWPDSVASVVTQGGGSQFNVWRPADPNYGPMISVTERDPDYRLALKAAREVMSGRAPDPTGGAFIYFNDRTSTDTGFTDKVKRLATARLDIGDHSFFRGVR